MNTEHEDYTTREEQPLAPWLPIPSRAISAIEHPCIVKNIDKGISSLGGSVKLSKAGIGGRNSHRVNRLTSDQGLRSKLDSTAGTENDEELKQLISVSLRPDDPFAKRLLSGAVTTKNLLLKVTVPKRTRRKRRRGTSGPFLTEEEIHQSDGAASSGSQRHGNNTYVDACTIVRSLQDNTSTYQTSLVGVIDETHRFRSKWPSICCLAPTDRLLSHA